MRKLYYSKTNGLFDITNPLLKTKFSNDKAWNIVVGSDDLLDQDKFPLFCQRLYDIVFVDTNFRKKLQPNKEKENSNTAEITILPIIIISEKPAVKIWRHFNSILFNSSIWFRFVCLETFENDYKKAKEEIEERSVLYEDDNAKEYFEYHLYLQSLNHLTNFKDKGHSSFVTPNIYSNEWDCLENIKNINFRNEQNKIAAKYYKSEIALYNNAYYNILLVDDKKKKGELIGDLLNNYIIEDDRKKTIWGEGQIEINFYKQNFKERESEEEYLKRNSEFEKKQEITKIFHVTTVKDAVSKLSADKIGNNPIRFDLILLDYLLEYKDGSKTEREYSSRLFEWLTNNKKEQSDSFGLGQSDEKLITAIKNNRGPLQKLWFFPITAFNQTFIDNLRNDGVRLIDYHWHISRGADPINTPNLFLASLNSFLYLQLQNAVYDLNTLTTFLNNTIERIKMIKVEDFQAHMGNEYTTIVQKHGWRSVISRDAKAGSSFSIYIWTNFYSKNENKYLFRLMDKMQKFFHICTFADETDYDKMMLYLKELDIFIADHWTELINEYADKFIDANGFCEAKKRNEERRKILDEHNIIRPQLNSFRNKINYFLVKNKN